MSRRPRDEDAKEFTAAVRGVRRLRGPERRALPKRSPRVDSETPPPAFEVSAEGTRHYGRRDDVSENELQALREGKLRAANRLDMHGMAADAARERVFRFVRQAAASGLRCVALVHGRGLRSADGPVLKAAVPRWLTQLPLAREVGAFASAPRDRGGDGVTLVLLRR